MTQPGQQVGSPCATCAPRQPPPAPATTVPCDFDAVQLICKHCGSENREITSFEFKLEGRRITHNLRTSPNRRRPLIDSTFDVIHDDEITVKIVGGPGPCGAHMLLVVTRPTGPPTRLVGQREHKFRAVFPNDWFERNIAAARGRPFLHAIRPFFYPSPDRYVVDVFACGRREGGILRAAAAFGSYSKRVDVYSSDIFGIKLKIPAFRKVTLEGSDMVTAAGDVAVTRTSSRTVERPYSRESSGFERRVVETDAGRTTTRTHTRSDRDGSDARAQSWQTGQSGSTSRRTQGPEGAVGHPLRQPEAVQVFRNRGDITDRFELVAWIDGVLGFLGAMQALIDGLKQLRSTAQLGWSFKLELTFLAGELSVEWGWKEWKKDHQIYRYWKVQADFTVFDARLEVNFGLKILKAEAVVYGAVTGSLKISAAREADPDDTRAPQEVLATGAAGGELGFRGALGDWVQVEGKVTAGIEGESKFTFAPFKWTVQAYRGKGEGTFTVRCKFWWDHTRTAELWRRAPIGQERVILG